MAPHLLLHHHQLHLPTLPLLHYLPQAPHIKNSCLKMMMNNPRTKSFTTTSLFRRQTLVRTVRCMASPRRVKMVAKQIQREISDMLVSDQVLQFAILPEASLGADRYLSSVTTISEVQISSDLQVAKVYVSVFGDERGKEVAFAGLKSKAKYVRGELGRRMRLRFTPEVRFIVDESLERGNRVIAILDKLKNEKKTEVGQYEEDSDFDSDSDSDSSDQPKDDEDSDEDDPDEGVIYVD